jgi:glycosyl transferase family 25
MMKNYVISLKSEQLRRQHIAQQFSQQHIAYQFFDAVTPLENLRVATHLKINNQADQLTAGEFSCLLSHASLWQKAIDENLDYIAIYEDDIHLGQNAASFLQHDQWIPQHCEVLKLEAFYSQIFVAKSKQYPQGDNRVLYELKSKHVGGGAYILSQKAAAVLLQALRQAEILKPIDHIVFDDYIVNGQLHILQLLPALCIQDYLLKTDQDTFQSALELERRHRFKTQTKQRGVMAKLKKEGLRLLMPLVALRNCLIYAKKKVEYR